MICGTNANNRFARFDKFADYFHLGFGQDTATSADQQQVGIVQHRNARQVIALFRVDIVAIDKTDAKFFSQVLEGKDGKRGFRFVLALSRDDDYVRSLVMLKLENLATNDLVTSDRGTNPFFDMLDN